MSFRSCEGHPIPFSGPISDNFIAGCMLRIQGRICPTAHNLAVTLLTGPTLFDDIALQVNLRFDKQKIYRNSRIRSNWGLPEKDAMPFMKDQNIEILILCELEFFKVAINGQHFANFTHKIRPLEKINHLRVNGDLTMSLIEIERHVVTSVTTEVSSVEQLTPPPNAGFYGTPCKMPENKLPYPVKPSMPHPCVEDTPPAVGFVMPMAPIGTSPQVEYPRIPPYSGDKSIPKPCPYPAKDTNYCVPVREQYVDSDYAEPESEQSVVLENSEMRRTEGIACLESGNHCGACCGGGDKVSGCNKTAWNVNTGCAKNWMQKHDELGAGQNMTRMGWIQK